MEVSKQGKSAEDESSTSVKPSELVMMAINNAGGKTGATEAEVVQMVAECLGAETNSVAIAVKTTLRNQVAVGLVTNKNGRYKLTETVKRCGREVARHRKMVKKRVIVPDGAKGYTPVVLGMYKCWLCGKQKRVIMNRRLRPSGR